MTQTANPTNPGQAPAPSPQQKRSRTMIILGAGCGCLVLVAGLFLIFGLPALLGYIKRTKAAEAPANLQALSALVSQECAAQGGYQGIVPAGPVPAVPKSAVQPADFLSDPGFSRVGFAPSPVLYSYSIAPNATGGVDLVAEGDLDEDGQRSRFVIACGADCSCDPQVMATDELE